MIENWEKSHVDLVNQRRDDYKESIQEIFSMYDKDKDGKINKEEFKALLKRFEEKGQVTVGQKSIETVSIKMF